MLRSLKPHSASGPDEISVWMLRTFADDIAPSVSALFNVSIAQGLLPADWKLSNIVPFPKEPGKQDIHFFNPISLLPVVSKVLERHLHQFLLDCLNSKGLLTDAQFGFPQTLLNSYSTTHFSPQTAPDLGQTTEGCLYFFFLMLRKRLMVFPIILS